MYIDGFKYWLSFKKNNISYYRCARYKNQNQCPGRCALEDGRVRNMAEHNHPPEPDRALVDKFRKVLTQRAACEKTELYVIYWEEAVQRHSDASLLYTFAAAESAMRKARRKQLPSAPATIGEVGDILSETVLFRVHRASQKDPFYQTTITLEDTTCVLFVHQKTVEAVGCVDEMQVDATIDVQPQMPPNYHLVSVHAIRQYNSVPILFAILTAKTQSGYAAVFSYLREHLSGYVKPNIIVCDFDQTMQTALAYTFPEAMIKGCWAHYTSAVLKQTKCLGLQAETAKGHGSCGLRMLLVLPLLPAEYMAPGLEALKKWMRDKKILTKDMLSLCDFIVHGWLRGVGVEKMSIFGMLHSVANHVQLFNQELRNLIGTPNPIVWQMLEALTQYTTKMYVKLHKMTKKGGSSTTAVGHTQKLHNRKSHGMVDTILKNATQLWIKTPVHLRNPLQFLQLCSHCIDGTTVHHATVDDVKNGNNTFDLTTTVQPSSNTSSGSITSAATSFAMQTINGMCADVSLMSAEQDLFIVEGMQQQQQQQRPRSHQLLQSRQQQKPQPQQQPHPHPHPHPQPQLQQQQIAPQIVNEQPVAIRGGSSDPPPLAFFRRAPQRRIIVMSDEPPPLVPIRNCQKK